MSVLNVGDTIPAVNLFLTSDAGPVGMSTHDLLKGKKTVLFSIPGAFTPTCTGQHVPSYLAIHKKIKAAGIDQIICLSVNDAFVMGAFKKSLGIKDEILMLCDGSATFAKASGLALDLSDKGLGMRAERYVMIIDDNRITYIQVEKSLGACTVSSANSVLAHLQANG